jgi:hypothetical protein
VNLLSIIRMQILPDLSDIMKKRKRFSTSENIKDRE